MSKLQEQVNSYSNSEGQRRQFMNFYRLVKTHSLLNNLFLSDSISRDVYNGEVKETLEKIHILKQQLEKYDIRRFCQLWGIETQFQNLGKMNSMVKSDIRVGIEVARIANMLPMINEEVYQASTYGQVHEPLSKFCIELSKLQQSEKSMTPAFKKTITNLLSLETSLAQRYGRLNESLSEESRDELKEGITKFRVEYEKVYRF